MDLEIEIIDIETKKEAPLREDQAIKAIGLLKNPKTKVKPCQTWNHEGEVPHYEVYQEGPVLQSLDYSVYEDSAYEGKTEKPSAIIRIKTPRENQPCNMNEKLKEALIKTIEKYREFCRE